MSSKLDTPPSSEGTMFEDVVMWRRKKLGVLVLVAATATWTVLQVYKFNFVTIVSWLAMFVVTSAFLWGNIERLFSNSRESPQMSGLEIPEQKAVELTSVIRSWIEEGIRWMFHVGAEGNFFGFAGTIAALWVASKISSCYDLLTLLYIGIVSGMTLPAIYTNYEDRFVALWERLSSQYRRLYSWINENAIMKIKEKIAGGKKVEKEKKVE